MIFTYDQQSMGDAPSAASEAERQRFARLLGGAEWLGICFSDCEVVMRDAVAKARAEGVRVDLLVFPGGGQGGSSLAQAALMEAVIKDKALGHRHLLVAEPAEGWLAKLVERVVPVIGLVRVTGHGLTGGEIPTSEAILAALKYTPRIC